MTSTIDADRFPEWEPFTVAVRQRRPDAGTWCEAWTVRDIVIHQSGNAEELARVLGAHLAGDPVSTRGFEEREAPFGALCDDDLWSTFTDRHLGTALATLTEPWMTDHTVYAVGTPLLTRGVKELGADERLFARLRVPGRDDVALTADPGRTTIERPLNWPAQTARRRWKRMLPHGFCCCGDAVRPTLPASAARRGPTRSGGCADYSAATDHGGRTALPVYFSRRPIGMSMLQSGWVAVCKRSVPQSHVSGLRVRRK